MKRSRLLVLCLALWSVPGWVISQEFAHGVALTVKLHALAPQTPEDLRALFKFTGEPAGFVIAHRGGARRGFPENCISTFAGTLRHTYAALEIDPRYTQDGEIVLHHDARLERTTTGQGLVADKTLAELKQLRLKGPDGAVTEFQIPTLDEVLEWARDRTILVLDQKDVPVAARVRKIEEHRAESYAVVIVYSFKDARACHTLNTNITMEVMIPDRGTLAEFEKLGVPWRNIVAFTGHTPPQDTALFELIHAKGVSCIVGTSRNLDRRLLEGQVGNVEALGSDYRALLQRGADFIETDLPTQVGTLLYADAPAPPSKRQFLIRK